MVFRRGGAYVETFTMDAVTERVDVREVSGFKKPAPAKKKFSIKKKAADGAATPPPPPR